MEMALDKLDKFHTKMFHRLRSSTGHASERSSSSVDSSAESMAGDPKAVV